MSIVNLGTGLTQAELRIAWRKCRDTYAGEDRIRSMGETYLPKYSGESVTAYKNRLIRASFLNPVRPTLNAALGGVFRKPAIVVFPDDRLPFESHGQAYSWEHLAQLTARDVLLVGRAFLIAVPVEDAGATMADARLRPTRVRFYAAEDVEDYKIDNGQLVFVRVQDNSCADDEALVYRIGADGYFEAAFVGNDGEDRRVAFPSVLGRRLAYIPGTFVGPESLDPCPQFPPFLDLANRALSAYVLAADYGHALHWTASPQPYAVGFDPTEVPRSLGPTTVIRSSNPEAKFGFAEFSGAGLSEMRAALNDLKAEMAALGASMLIPKGGSNVAARTVELRQREDSSVVISVVSMVEAAINRVMRFMLDWEQKPGAEASITLNRDLVEAVISPELLRGLRESLLSGAISFETWVSMLQKGEVIPPTRSAQDELGLIESGPFNADMVGAAA